MKRWLTFLLVVISAIAGWGWGEREQGLWRLLQPPRFRTLQGTLQVSVFSERMGDRVWTINLWADERNSRTQLMLPHPEGARQIITITMPEGMWVFLPFADGSGDGVSGSFCDRHPYPPLTVSSALSPDGRERVNDLSRAYRSLAI
jgi:hypothetical protein